MPAILRHIRRHMPLRYIHDGYYDVTLRRQSLAMYR